MTKKKEKQLTAGDVLEVLQGVPKNTKLFMHERFDIMPLMGIEQRTPKIPNMKLFIVLNVHNA